MARPRQARNVVPVKLTVARVVRLRHALSQADVRQLTGIPVETISRVERGLAVPSADDLAALARVYNFATPSRLLDDVALEQA